MKFAEAALLLGVDARTIRRWASHARTREALLVVRHGKQWRIPKPEDSIVWEAGTRERLKAVGIRLSARQDKHLQGLANRNKPFWKEVHRLYLAASLKALRRGRISAKARGAIADLCQEALNLLRSQDKRVGVEGMKNEFPRQLWRYWPLRMHFDKARESGAPRRIEEERREADFIHAVRSLKRRDIKPTAANLATLLHLDWIQHMNDTKEKVSVAVWDFRQEQTGISIRECRRRYKLKVGKWKIYIATIYNHRTAEPFGTPMENQDDD